MKKQSQTEQIVASVYQNSYDVFCKNVIEVVVIGSKVYARIAEKICYHCH